MVIFNSYVKLLEGMTLFVASCFRWTFLDSHMKSFDVCPFDHLYRWVQNPQEATIGHSLICHVSKRSRIPPSIFLGVSFHQRCPYETIRRISSAWSGRCKKWRWLRLYPSWWFWPCPTAAWHILMMPWFLVDSKVASDVCMFFAI